MLRHYEKIDGLRCIATSMVLFEHFAYYVARPTFVGFYGLDLFFVISGFLVTSVLLKAPDRSFGVNYKNYIIRRTLRIFPLYYFAVILLFILNTPGVRDNIFYLLTYTFNYAIVFKDLPALPISPFWSLCVEEQFYLFWPIVVLVLRKNIPLLKLVILFIIIIAYLQQIFNLIPSLAPYNYYSLLARMGAMGIGSLGAVYFFTNRLPTKFFKSKRFEYLMFGVLVISLITTFKFKLLALAICSLYFVIKATKFNSVLDPILRNKRVRYIGVISYGIYIFHLSIAHYMDIYVVNPIIESIKPVSWGLWHLLRQYEYDWIIRFPLYSLLSVIVSAFFYKYLETPFLKLKEKIGPSRNPGRLKI